MDTSYTEYTDDTKALPELALFYNCPGRESEPQSSSSVESVLLRLGIPLARLSEDSLKETIGYCSGLEGFAGCTRDNEPALPVSALVLGGLSNERLDALLKELRAANAGQNVLKAVITPHNIRWRLCDLLRELSAENDMMRQYKALCALVARAEAALAGDNGNKVLSTALQKGIGLLQSRAEMTHAELEKSVAEIQSALTRPHAAASSPEN